MGPAVYSDRAVRLARRVVDKILEQGRPYALFVRGLEVELCPADGRRFEAISRRPDRMALCVGVFNAEVSVDQVAAEIESAL